MTQAVANQDVDDEGRFIEPQLNSELYARLAALSGSVHILINDQCLETLTSSLSSLARRLTGISSIS